MWDLSAVATKPVDDERLQSSIIAALDQGVVVLDLQERLVEANPAARAMLGLDLGCACVDPDWRQPFTASRIGGGSSPHVGGTVMRTGKEIRDVEVVFERAKGESVLLSVSYLPLRDDVGAVRGLVLSFSDVTEKRHEQELARQSVAQSRDFLQITLDSLQEQIAVLGEHSDVIMTNRAWTRFAGEATDPAAHGDNYLAVCDAATDEWSQRSAIGLRAILAGEQSEFSMEYPCNGAQGGRWFVLRATRYRGSGDARIVIARSDVTTRRRAETEVTTQAALLDEIDVAVVATSLDGRITHWNRGAERLYGWTRSEAIDRNAHELIVPVDADRGREIVAELHRAGHWEGESSVFRNDGSTFPAYLRDRIITGGDGLPSRIIGVSVDISAPVTAKRALLATRNYLRAVTDSMGEGMFTLDTDGRVTYMNETAEKLLGWPLAELKGCVMHEIAHSRRPDGSKLPAEECPILQARRGETVRIEDDLFIRRDGCQLPVAYTAAPFETEDGVEGCVVVFRDISESKAREASLQDEVEKLAWIDRVQRAITERRFVLYAQPIIDLRSRHVVQRELLLRVREPDGSIVAPGGYLDIAERYGLIGDIDRWVIQRGVETAASGRAVQINVSARSISDWTILDHIERCIEQAGADPRMLVFEITETALVRDEAAARVFAERLHRLGCKLALDDFGTGYGGFTYLKQLPVDFLKIDIEFVADLASNSASRHVVEAVVALARAFSLQTVAEGVENAETLELLLELGVDFAQGYHIAKPEDLLCEDLECSGPAAQCTISAAPHEPREPKTESLIVGYP
jgi:PAS domain S-box-containing protein